MVSQHNCFTFTRILTVAFALILGGTLARQIQGQEVTPARTTQTYSIQPAKLENVSTVLRQLFDGTPDVTISTQPANGQLIVTAPLTTQAQIASFVQRSGYQMASASTNTGSELRVRSQYDRPPQATPFVQQPTINNPQPATSNYQRTKDLGSGLTELEIKLNNLRGEALESGIVKLIGKRIPVSFTAEGALVMMTLPTNTEKKVSLQVYRNEGTAILRGQNDAASSWAEVIRAMDTPSHSDAYRTTLVSLRNASRENVEKALDPLRDIENSLAKRHVFEALKGVGENKKLRWSGDMAAMIFQPGDQPQPANDDNAVPPAPAEDDNTAQIVGQKPGQKPIEVPAEANPNNPQITISPEQDGGLIGPVQIEFLEGLDVIVVRGHKRDVERITNIINDIERLSVETQPVIEVRELLHANSEAVATIINELYESLLNTRYGQVSITALNRPNAILLIGREQSVAGIMQLIDKLDTPVGPAKALKVFQLEHLAATDAQTRLTEFFAEPTGLGTRIRVTSDSRSNALIVAASPRDMVEIEYLIKQIDVAQSKSTLKLEVVQLRNSVAEDLAPILQEAISGVPAAGTSNQNTRYPASSAVVRTAMLSFMTLDAKGKQIMQSGILNEVQVTADTRSNSLIIRAPENSMALIIALVKHLDAQPSAESQIKVFTVINGDATQLTTMLNELFQTVQSSNSQARNSNAFSVPGATAGGESSLIPLNFAVDTRTNSIIASGSATDLTVVEAILLRLDQDEVMGRKNTVVRLQNNRADLVAASLADLLGQINQLQTIDPSVVSPFQQLNREVIVVPDLFSNSVIISATPQYYDQVLKVIEKLDAQPPMVMLQVLIANVSLGDTEELGFELGLQDSILFDRSVVSSDTGSPGFNWNNQPLGNATNATSLATATAAGAQGLTNFSLGRTGAPGYGGFVFSAASDSVNVLIRALEQENRAEILARPQIMTMDNQPGFIQAGQRVPYITSTQQTNNGTINSTTLINTGIILSVTPRISPDGTVVMALQAERSDVGSDADGIPISINQAGQVIRSPRIDTQTATAVISARSGQTAVFGGLISNSTTVTNRKVPWVGDVPIVGRFFRYDSYVAARTELLIIITPIVIRNDADNEMLKRQEMCRMSWCLADVANVYGPEVLYGVDNGMPMDACVYCVNPDENPADVPEEIYPANQPPKSTAPLDPFPGPGPQVPPQSGSYLPPGTSQFYGPADGQLQPASMQSVEVQPLQYQRPVQQYMQEPVIQEPLPQQYMQAAPQRQPSVYPAPAR